MKLDALTKLIGVTRLDTVEDVRLAMHLWKSQMISARRRDDTELAVVLSQAKEVLKKLLQRKAGAHCQRCGVIIHRTSLYCGMCRNIVRYYPRTLPVLRRKHSFSNPLQFISPHAKAPHAKTQHNINKSNA